MKILETFETYQYCDSKLRGLNQYRFPDLGPLKTEIFSQSSLLSFIFVFASSLEIQFKCRLWKFFFLIFCLLEMIFTNMSTTHCSIIKGSKGNNSYLVYLHLLPLTTQTNHIKNLKVIKRGRLTRTH